MFPQNSVKDWETEKKKVLFCKLVLSELCFLYFQKHKNKTVLLSMGTVRVILYDVIRCDFL